MKSHRLVSLFTKILPVIFLILLFVAFSNGFAPKHSVSAGSNFPAPKAANQIFLPIVFKNDHSALTPLEQEIYNLMRQDPNQQRAALNCNPKLIQVARSRAQDMGVRHYFSHVNPDGFGPNYLVRKTGYLLPSNYDQSNTGNNIESIVAGCDTAMCAWTLWMNSTPHRTHILGLDPFFAQQTQCGIGYAYVPNSPYGYYWVILTAKPGP